MLSTIISSKYYNRPFKLGHNLLILYIQMQFASVSARYIARLERDRCKTRDNVPLFATKTAHSHAAVARGAAISTGGNP